MQNDAENGKPDDVKKDATVQDDLFDGCKYLIAEWSGIVTTPPREVRREQYVSKGANMQAQYLRSLEFDAEEKRGTVRGRRR